VSFTRPCLSISSASCQFSSDVLPDETEALFSVSRSPNSSTACALRSSASWRFVASSCAAYSCIRLMELFSSPTMEPSGAVPPGVNRCQRTKSKALHSLLPAGSVA